MYLAAIHVTLDLEPEVPSSDRERVLRALRDRLRQTFSGRLVVRTDEDSVVAVSLLDDNFERIQARCNEVIERLEAAGEARLLTYTIQIFAWHEGRYVEIVSDKGQEDEEMFAESKIRHGAAERTFVYDGPEDSLSNRTNLNTRFDRKNVRLPIRKP